MEFSNPATPNWNAEVKAKYGGGNKKFACVGYCALTPLRLRTTLMRDLGYGAPYVCDSLAKDGICSVGAFAHPAFLKESHFENLTSSSPMHLHRVHSTDGIL